ncbi:MAG: RNA polymerase sigma factor [Bacilli bacterium]
MANYEDYIEAIKQKDDQAFEYIYNSTKNSVYAIIVAIVKDKDIANDLMQDTYMTMIEKINQYKRGRNFKTWLLTIARNKAIDYYRKKQNEVLIDISESEYILPKTQATSERNILVEEILNLLTDIERQVFLLSIMENLTHREISKILKIPIGTSLWHYQKAIKKIKKVKGSDEHET